jgi:hypothetical protein
VKTITLSGVTGWRGTLGSPSGESGEDLFVNLHRLIMTSWHLQREVEAKEGYDPDQVLLILSDGLDNLNWVVAPQTFVLKRNKSRPLMAQYNISMHRLGEAHSELSAPPPSAEAAKDGAVVSLAGCLVAVDGFAATLKGMLKGVIGAIKGALSGVLAFVKMTGDILRAVISDVKAIVGAVSSVTSGLIEIAQAIAQAGMNVAMTFAAITTLPQQIKALFQQVGSAYSNMMCVLRNIFKKRTFLPEYDIYGSGNCASTSGGSAISPYVTMNTFEAVLTASDSKLKVSETAAQSLRACIATDPVLGPLSLYLLGLYAQQMSTIAVKK